MAIGLCLIGAMSCLLMSQDLLLEPEDKRVRICRKQGTCNQLQNVTEHHAFRVGSIMLWAGISLGYHTDLYIFKRGSVTADRYRD
ncbi:transposable element Tcb1 transposase [Trichonephila clavipes]|nr:transposable element Tcb1 transposase [Trichonephila clavipes]